MKILLQIKSTQFASFSPPAQQQKNAHKLTQHTPGGHNILKPLVSSVRANTHQFPFNRQPVSPSETFTEPGPEVAEGPGADSTTTGGGLGTNVFEDPRVEGPTVAMQQSRINAHQIMMNFPELQVCVTTFIPRKRKDPKSSTSASFLLFTTFFLNQEVSYIS